MKKGQTYRFGQIVEIGNKIAVIVGKENGIGEIPVCYDTKFSGGVLWVKIEYIKRRTKA